MTSPTKSVIESATVPISTPAKSTTIDQSVIPYVRAREVEFSAVNLRPNRDVFCFFDDINVTRFVQRASKVVTDSGNNVFGLVKGERLYCNSTHGFASVIAASPNTSVYINENYIALNVNAVGANTLGGSDYVPGDLVYQVPTITSEVDAATFVGKVVYWNNADKVIVLDPILGTLNVNNSPSNTAVLFKSGVDRIVYAANTVQGNKFPTNAIISSLDNISNRFLVNTWEHRSGVVATTTSPNANSIVISGTAPSDAVGNFVFISAHTGLGQAGLVLSVNGNAVYTNTTFSPTPSGNTYYSMGLPTVDEVGMVAGVYNIPATETVKFLTGTRKFTISDSIIVDDPDATMLATDDYLAQGFLGTADRATPIVSPVTTPAIGTSPVKSTSSVVKASTQAADGGYATATAGPTTTYSGVKSTVASNSSSNGIYNGYEAFGVGAFNVNPVAQTFFTPPPKSAKANYGIFVSSIDLWFKERPTGSSPKFPVLVKIVQVDNGYPTEDVIATSLCNWHEIKISDTPDSANIGSNFGSNQTATKFRFADPVYLAPATEYAIVVYSESPEYEVFISELGQSDITAGNSNRRISEQPSAGSFFRSQNSSTWTPYQNQDLMFVINKCVFDTSPVSFSFNVDPIQTIKVVDSLLLHSSDVTFPATSLIYKVRTTLANTFAQEASYREIVPNQQYSFGEDLSVSSSASNRRRVVLPGNSSSLQVQVSMHTNDPDISPIFNAERLAVITTGNIINNGQINPENITIIDGGAHSNASNITVTISAPDLEGGAQATANVMELEFGTSVPFLTILNPGSGYFKSPTITISEPGATRNATAVFVGEDSKSGGNGIARYITRKITLADGFDSGDLRVYLNAIRPAGTHIQVYYKVLSATDTENFLDKPWKAMEIVKDLNSPDQSTQIELEFTPNLGPNDLPAGKLSYTVGNTTYPLGGKFKHFALKIVLFANDPTVIPQVLDMRCIAVPAG